ncbi:MAG: hypothetical protein ACRD28_05795 [Acidobacteriaceae bacterium]
MEFGETEVYATASTRHKYGIVFRGLKSRDAIQGSCFLNAEKISEENDRDYDDVAGDIPRNVPCPRHIGKLKIGAERTGAIDNEQERA